MPSMLHFDTDSDTTTFRGCSPPSPATRSTTPSALSTLDVLWVLYDRVLRVDPREPDDPDRDRFLLSKGHGPAAYYAVLAAKGFVDAESLAATSAASSQPARLSPRPHAGPGRRDLAAARSATGCRLARRHRARRSTPSGRPAPASSCLRRRRRARRGQQPRGDRSSRAGSASDGSRWSSSTTTPRPTTGPAASPRASRSRAGARHASTAAITTRSSARWRPPDRDGRTWSWR